MSFGTSRPAASIAVPLTQNTAPIHEFACLYTHDIQRKRQKRWQDGFLRFHTFNKRVMVYDVPRSRIGETFLKDRDLLEDGDELTLDRGVMVQVCEQKGVVEQDRAEILEKIRPQQQQRTPSKQTSGHRQTSSGLSAPSPRPIAQPTRVQFNPATPLNQLRPKPLNAILGTNRGAHGRATLPKVSPYQERQAQQEESSRSAKRQRMSTREELEDRPQPWPREVQQPAKPAPRPPAPEPSEQSQHDNGRIANSTVGRGDRQDVVQIHISDDEPILIQEQGQDQEQESQRTKSLSSIRANPSNAPASDDRSASSLRKVAIEEPEVPRYRRLLREHQATQQKPMSKLRSAVSKRKSLMYQNLLDRRANASQAPNQPALGEIANSRVREALQPNDRDDQDRAVKTISVNQVEGPAILQNEHVRLGRRRYSSGNSSESDAFEPWEKVARSKKGPQLILPVVEAPSEQPRNPTHQRSEKVAVRSDGPESTMALPSLSMTTTEALQTLDQNLSVRPALEARNIQLTSKKSAPTEITNVTAQAMSQPRIAAQKGDTSTSVAHQARPILPPPSVPGRQLLPPPSPQRALATSKTSPHPVRPPEVGTTNVIDDDQPDPGPKLRRRESPLKKSLTDTAVKPAQNPNKALQRSNTGDWQADKAAREAEAAKAAEAADVGPWSREAYELFGFMGGETWTVGPGGEFKETCLGANSPAELVERQKELVRQAKKACRGMGGSTIGQRIMDEYDYVESTYS